MRPKILKQPAILVVLAISIIITSSFVTKGGKSGVVDIKDVRQNTHPLLTRHIINIMMWKCTEQMRVVLNHTWFLSIAKKATPSNAIKMDGQEKPCRIWIKPPIPGLMIL